MIYLIALIYADTFTYWPRSPELLPALQNLSSPPGSWLNTLREGIDLIVNYPTYAWLMLILKDKNIFQVFQNRYILVSFYVIILQILWFFAIAPLETTEAFSRHLSSIINSLASCLLFRALTLFDLLLKVLFGMFRQN